LPPRKSGGPRARRTLIDGLAFSADRHELFVSVSAGDLTKAAPIPLKGTTIFARANQQRSRHLDAGRPVRASFLNDNTIVFWDPAKGRAIGGVEPDKKKGDWHAFAFTPAGKFAANGLWFSPIRQMDEPLDNTVAILDVAAAQACQELSRRQRGRRSCGSWCLARWRNARGYRLPVTGSSSGICLRSAAARN